MTAEIAILNREAVAMAADSAATVQVENGQKIFASANKIFSLSKHHPVGIMVYGSALFMGIPWETIIKVYRKKLGETKFKTLYEYFQDFIKFLQEEEYLFPENIQENYVKGSVNGYFISLLREEYLENIKIILKEKNEVKEEETKQVLYNVIEKHLNLWKNCNNFLTNHKNLYKSILEKYDKVIEDSIIEVFEKLPISQDLKNNLKELAGFLFVAFPKELMNEAVSGVVISGFGDDEIFPSIVTAYIEGIANNILKYKEGDYESIDYEKNAMIIPLAQREMVDTFIYGISPRFVDLYNKLLFNTIEEYPKIIIDTIIKGMNDDEKIELIKKIKETSIINLEKGLESVRFIQFKQFIEPILRVVTFLPKNELAEMAESLVNLTCLRKKISMDEETVGGPIDVAVISKGDGLIWIKRKHYFDAKLNQHFFINYLEK